MDYNLLMNRAPRFTARDIKPVLVRQGRKQRWIAEQIGFTEAHVSNIIRGKRTIDGVRAEKIAHLLGESVHCLFMIHESND